MVYSDFQVFCKRGARETVAKKLKEMTPLFSVTTQTKLSQMVDHAYTYRGGTFVLLYLNGFVISLLAFLTISGFGLTERRREFGLLKACGWAHWELLEMIALEGIVLGLVGTSIAILTSRILVKLLNGIFLGQVFISDCGIVPNFPMPAEFSLILFVACLAYAMMLTTTGTILRTYRWLHLPPAETMR